MSNPTSSVGFIRVACTACNNPDVWFTCNTCSKSDHFSIDATGDAPSITCDCGAHYDHGTCTCGQTVPFEDLVFVDLEAGPLALADLEVAWGRVAMLILLVILILGGVGYGLFA